jgi:hypothetical protein
MSQRSAGIKQIDLDPSDLAGQTHIIANGFEAIRAHEANRVHASGVGSKAPTTPSAQFSGAGGITEWRIDLDPIVVTVDGDVGQIAAQTDLVIHDTTNLLQIGQSIMAAVVAKNVAGVISLEIVKGAVATTGTEQEAGDAAITAAVGAGNHWVQISDLTLSRTADTVLDQNQDNSARPILGVNVSVGFGGFAG